MRVRDLPKTPAHGVVLFCPACLRSWSANRGDYFMLPDEHEFTCDCMPARHTTLALGKEVRRFVRV